MSEIHMDIQRTYGVLVANTRRNLLVGVPVRYRNVDSALRRSSDISTPPSSVDRLRRKASASSTNRSILQHHGQISARVAQISPFVGCLRPVKDLVNLGDCLAPQGTHVTTGEDSVVKPTLLGKASGKQSFAGTRGAMQHHVAKVAFVLSCVGC